jgi:hypothetical protein
MARLAPDLQRLIMSAGTAPELAIFPKLEATIGARNLQPLTHATETEPRIRSPQFLVGKHCRSCSPLQDPCPTRHAFAQSIVFGLVKGGRIKTQAVQRGFEACAGSVLGLTPQ